MIGHMSQSALIRNLTVIETGKLKTTLRIQNVTLCRVSVSPVAGVTTEESVVTPNSREFHFLPGGLFVA
jgi:hypothetical protein